MKIRSVVALLCRTIAGIGSFFVSAYGLYSLSWANLRQNTVEMSLFCILPLLSLPIFLLSFKTLRWSVALHWISAITYLVVYSLLDWRTCSELGYCEGAGHTVLKTLTARPVEAVFAVAIFNLAGLLLRAKPRSAPNDK